MVLSVNVEQKTDPAYEPVAASPTLGPREVSALHDYPRMLVRTSTRDDRVHTGHARKLAHKLQAMGCPAGARRNVVNGFGVRARYVIMMPCGVLIGQM